MAENQAEAFREDGVCSSPAPFLQKLGPGPLSRPRLLALASLNNLWPSSGRAQYLKTTKQ